MHKMKEEFGNKAIGFAKDKRYIGQDLPGARPQSIFQAKDPLGIENKGLQG